MLKKFYLSYIAFLQRFSWIIASAIVIIVLAFIPTIKNLGFKLAFEDMLQEDSRALKNISKLTESYGGEGHLIVSLSHSNYSYLISNTSHYAEKLADLEEIVYETHKINTGFFESNALLYMELEDLQKFEKRVQQKIEQERRRANPLVIQFEDENEIGFDDILVKYQDKLPQKYFVNASSNKTLILLKPSGNPNDTEFNGQLIKGVSYTLGNLPPDIEYKLSGRYYEAYIDTNEVRDDFSKLSILSVLFITLLLLITYRRVNSLFIILFPLVVSVLCNFALTVVTIGHLNLLSSSLTGILMGLGLDFGIHLFSRYLDERRKDQSVEQSLAIAMSQTGLAAFAGAITTATAFYSLLATEFKGFNEFGFIAGNGMLLNSFFMMTLFPLTIVILEKFPNNRWFKIHVPAVVRKKSFLRYLFLIISRRPKVTRLLIYPLIGIALGLSLYSRFDGDYSKLKGESRKLTEERKDVEAILGISLSPTYLVVKSKDELYKVSQSIHQQLENGELPLIRTYRSLDLFIPENQDKKLRIIARLRNTYRQYKNELLRSEASTIIKKYSPSLNARKITMENIPEGIQREFRGKNKQDFYISLHPNFPVTDMTYYEKYLAPFFKMEKPENGTYLGSISYILLEIYRQIIQEGPKVIFLSFLLSFLAIWILFRNLRYALMVSGGLLSGIMLMLACMVVSGLKFNLINIIILPMLLGIGIDSSIHICHRYIEEGKKNIYNALYSIHEVVILSCVTTIIGFAVLVFASYSGLKTMGIVSIVGLTCVLFAALFILPAFLPWLNPLLINKKQNLSKAQLENKKNTKN